MVVPKIFPKNFFHILKNNSFNQIIKVIRLKFLKCMNHYCTKYLKLIYYLDFTLYKILFLSTKVEVCLFKLINDGSDQKELMLPLLSTSFIQISAE